MKRILGLIGFLLMLQGAAGLVHHWAGWFDAWTVVHRIGALDGNEVVANVALIVVGLLVASASDRR